VGEFALYIAVLLISHTFVVLDVSATILVHHIHNINPLKEIVINYQNGGDSKSMEPPCVVLVINENPYGLMVTLIYICRTCS
jgi:hypothetical protein